MNIREVNVNSQRTQILKEGRVVDQNSTTTKEVRLQIANFEHTIMILDPTQR